MISAFARRLFIVTALELAGAFGAIVLAGALLALNTYVDGVRADVTATLRRVIASLDTAATRHDARLAAGSAAARYPRATVDILLIDADHRVEIYQGRVRGEAAIVDVRSRAQPRLPDRTTGVFARLVLGLVTILGVTSARAHVGQIDVIVRPNPEELVATAAAYLPEFALAMTVALGIAMLLARFLTRQVLRPLVDVMRALEGFAAGDLTPQIINADSREQLAPLAVAYNGAIAQMERAFRDRDRANGAMRQFIADAGHQLRTPLTVVRGFISILCGPTPPSSEDAQRILETMNRQTALMADLIDKLLLLEGWDAREDGADGARIDVAQMVSDVVSPIAESYPRRRLRVDAPSAGLARIVPTDFAHALTNLVDNALKYSVGTIDVTVRREADAIVVEVGDEGPGMTPNEATHAFDRFFRGSRRDVEGSGLGLAIARRAVERAGGTLSVTSDVTSGSRFAIALPVAR